MLQLIQRKSQTALIYLEHRNVEINWIADKTNFSTFIQITTKLDTESQLTSLPDKSEFVYQLPTTYKDLQNSSKTVSRTRI